MVIPGKYSGERLQDHWSSGNLWRFHVWQFNNYSAITDSIQRRAHFILQGYIFLEQVCLIGSFPQFEDIAGATLVLS